MGAWPRQGSKEKTDCEHNREIERQKPLGRKRRTQKQHQKKNKRQETHMAIPGTQISDPNNLGQAAANPVVAMVAASKFFLGRLFRPGESCLVYTCSFDRGKEKLTYVGLTVVPSGMSQNRKHKRENRRGRRDSGNFWQQQCQCPCLCLEPFWALAILSGETRRGDRRREMKRQGEERLDK